MIPPFNHFKKKHSSINYCSFGLFIRSFIFLFLIKDLLWYGRRVVKTFKKYTHSQDRVHKMLKSPVKIFRHEYKKLLMLIPSWSVLLRLLKAYIWSPLCLLLTESHQSSESSSIPDIWPHYYFMAKGYHRDLVILCSVHSNNRSHNRVVCFYLLWIKSIILVTSLNLQGVG